MRILIKQAKILDKQSTHNGKTLDILIQDGLITEIGAKITNDVAIVIEHPDLHISQGWVDLKAHFCDPGEEHKETIKSGLDAAAYGGFTHVATLPSTKPVIDNKSQVNYLLSHAESEACDLHPMACITEGMKGESLSEMYDLHQHGVRFFSDDLVPLNSGILYRALLYSKNFGGTIVAFARNHSLSDRAMVNEGSASLKTGLKAEPEIAEIIDIERNLRLLEYTGGNLHLTGISCAESVKLIREAKKQGLNVSADVHVMQLLFNETAVEDFDENYKVLPVLRTEKDRLALIEGVKDGTIDAIASDHRPYDKEEKDVEFDHAAFGNIQLQTVFASLHSAGILSLADLIEILSFRNRETLQIQSNPIEKGNNADLTLFLPNEKWEFNSTEIISNTRNTPFINQNFTGKVAGIINKSKLALKDFEIEKR